MATMMTWSEAVAVLASREGDLDEARHVVTRDLCDALGRDDSDGALGDWLAAGAWSGSETLTQIVAEVRRAEA